MTTKILIDTPTFEAILKRHPEVEVDLIRAVTPQIAARIGDRIKAEIAKIEAQEAEVADGRYDARLKTAITRQLEAVGDRYGRVPDGVKAAARAFLKEECGGEAKALLWGNVDKEIARRVGEACDKRVGEVRAICQKMVNDAQATIDAHAKQAAEREVMTLLRAGRLTVTP